MIRLPVDDQDLARSLEIASERLGEEFVGGTILKEARLQEHLQLALAENVGAAVERERHIEVPGFQGVGAVDIVISDQPKGRPTALVECKWSVDAKRDKIFESAWDAVKLALAAAKHDAKAWLVTGAPARSWKMTETPDLFADGRVDSSELWARDLYARGPNGGTTVGGDCEAGGRGNMFTHAPEMLYVRRIAEVELSASDVLIRAARVSGEGKMVRFGNDPEFPASIGGAWLAAHVPNMPQDQFERLLARLRAKRWSDTEIDERVRTLRTQS